MAAGHYNIYIEQGATYDQTFTWTDNNDVPINLTGYTARMQIRRDVAEKDVTIDFDVTTSGTITLGGSAGTIHVKIPATGTAGITSGEYKYDLELQHTASGDVTRLLQGAVTVDPEVTKN
jgi:hypothetical protein